jgi:hypothetical protein
MRFTTFLLLTAVSFTTVFVGCKKDDDAPNPPRRSGNILFDINVLANGNSVNRAEVFSIDTLFDFMITDLKFYYSNVEFKNSNGEWIKAEPKVLLFDWRNYTEADNTISLAPGTYSAVRYHLGLDSATNRTMPTDPSLSFDDPLSAAKAMHWNWNLFYRFVIAEGRVNYYGEFVTDPSAPIQNPLFSIHPGTDVMLHILENQFTSPIEIKNNETKNLVFEVNTNMWADGPAGPHDLVQENQGHAEPHDFVQTQRFGDNFAAGLTLKVK